MSSKTTKSPVIAGGHQIGVIDSFRPTGPIAEMKPIFENPDRSVIIPPASVTATTYRTNPDGSLRTLCATYYDRFLQAYGETSVLNASVDAIFEALMGIDWEQRPDAPRKEYYCNDIPVPYTYGKGAGVRTYHPRVWPAHVRAIQGLLENLLATRFEVCFLNRYDHGREHLGWHADDSPEMDHARPIAVVTLGSSRRIELRNKDDKALLSTTELGHGSLFIMGKGAQLTTEHRIPKEGRVVGPRISLTFRGYVRLGYPWGVPHTKCPGCGYEEPFHPFLRDPITETEITLEEWYRRVRARFGQDVNEDSVLPIRCSDCTYQASTS